MAYSPETPLSEITFTVLDFETTGTVKGFECLPWQVGAVTVSAQNGLRCDAPHFDTLMRVPLGHPFSGRAPGRHAQLRAEIALAPTAQEVWLKLHAALSTTIPVAHNAATERTILEKRAPLSPFGPWIDTLKLVRQAWPHLPSYALGDLIAAFGLTEHVNRLCPGRTWHDALYDACAGAVLYCFLLKQLPSLSRNTFLSA
jgi:DNA polymerase-3 subunit epsilon